MARRTRDEPVNSAVPADSGECRREPEETFPIIAANPRVIAPWRGGRDDIPNIEAVLQVLRDTTGVDFTQYKRNTLCRRIVRRLVLHRIDSIAEYARFLHANPAEAETLYQDFLIDVTSFFRNPEAFEALKQEVFPALTENRSREDPVRIWALGCSTGEEAYSIAIAFFEFAEALGHSVPVQIFGTDLNASSIDRARTGIYSASALGDVSPERIRRFFVQLDGAYRIAKSIRDACVFTCHNVLEDAPFSHIDLVSCRNMLIYLDTELRQKVIPVLHCALRPRGWLFLGTSESLCGYRELFEFRNTRLKLYIKKQPRRHTLIPTRTMRAAPLDSEERKVDIEVLPVKSGVEQGDMFMVLFEDAGKAPATTDARATPQNKNDTDQEIARLKHELAATREYLQSVIERQEAANEELQSANEEVQFANQELQSINEDLEASKEEVQSTNEALAALNDELHSRNCELALINHDLLNLLSSVQIAIVVLDPSLRIRRYTPMAQKLLKLIPGDIGRPVSDIKSGFEVPDLAGLVKEAIDSVSERELEVQDPQGRWYLMRIRPCRTLENKIDGAVLILVDVDTLKRSEERSHVRAGFARQRRSASDGE